jgi:hypothetical protein
LTSADHWGFLLGVKFQITREQAKETSTRIQTPQVIIAVAHVAENVDSIPIPSKCFGLKAPTKLIHNIYSFT